jgi:hypothetical protein
MLGLAGAFLVVLGAPASAGECVDETTGQIKYCSDSPGTNPGTGNPSDSGGGSSQPSCEYTGSYNEFCEGTAACWGNNPAANSEDAVADELGPKPDDEEAHPAYKKCQRPDGTTYDDWYWATPGDGPTLAELAQRAFGALRIPAFAATFNPPTATYVNLDTWWWAQGVEDGPLVGSSALGLRAIATPQYMQIDPGDGSGVQRCTFSVTKSDTCVYVYRRSSDRLPGKAYPARMRLQYGVTFERNGTPLTIPGAPNALASPWQPVSVPVREVQTVTRPND